MSKIAKAFENKKAFIPFVTAGDPTLDVTEQLLYEMQKREDAHTGLATLCIGGGQGQALIVKK